MCMYVHMCGHAPEGLRLSLNVIPHSASLFLRQDLSLVKVGWPAGVPEMACFCLASVESTLSTKFSPHSLLRFEST